MGVRAGVIGPGGAGTTGQKVELRAIWEVLKGGRRKRKDSFGGAGGEEVGSCLGMRCSCGGIWEWGGDSLGVGIWGGLIEGG